MNPIIRHEWRTRWRSFRAMGLLLAFFIPIAVMVVIRYGEASPWKDSLGDTSNIGRTLFYTISGVQTLAWMLLAPTLTATTISGERERGLFESLQLSPLSPRQIILGKLTSALAFASLMLIAATPAIAICFLLGGVAPEDFLKSILLQGATTVFCATAGLTFSALTRRGAIGLRATFIAIVVWVIGSLAMAALAASLGGQTAPWAIVGLGLMRLFGSSNPLIVAFSLESPFYLNRYSIISSANPPVLLVMLDDLSQLSGFWLCILFQVIMCPLLLWIATRAVRKPLGEQYWFDPKQSTGKPIKRHRETSGAKNPVTHSHSPSMWWEIPFASQLTFRNPILQRETRSKFRMRRVPPWAVIFEIFLAIAVAGFYVRTAIWAITKPDLREVIWFLIAIIGVLVIMVSTAMMGASNFTREREAGTFEGLMLSLVSGGEILIGKLGAPLIACLFFTLPLLPLLIFCLDIYGNSGGRGVSLPQAVLTFAILGSTGWFHTALGTLFSWHAKRTAAAVGWVMGALVVVDLFLPIMLSQSEWNAVANLHPVVALVRMTDSNFTDNEGFIGAIMAILLHILAGFIIYWRLLALSARRARERDSRSG
jgi:ABC-type transport system involved in multi-copper enzyme maturation permease subunit